MGEQTAVISTLPDGLKVYNFSDVRTGYPLMVEAAEHNKAVAADRERIAALEALLRTTVDLLSDTDSLVLEQLTIDIACILPVQ